MAMSSVMPGGHQVGVAVIGAPFVTRAIDRAVGVADEQARFEPAQDFRIRVIHGQFETFSRRRCRRGTSIRRSARNEWSCRRAAPSSAF